VFFRFDRDQIGWAHPNSKGEATVDGVSVPGAVQPGHHTITAACSTGGRAVASSSFEVVDAAVHRSELVTRIPHPWQVDWSAKNVAASALAGLLLILVVALPAELFNSTLEENYEEVKAWFRLPRKVLAIAGGMRQGTALMAFVALGGVLYSALSSDFGFNWSSVALVLGTSIALIVTTVGFGLPANFYMHKRFGEWGRVAVLPGTLLVSVVFVAFSKLMGVQPGLLYGLLAGFTFRQKLGEKEHGRLTAGSSLLVLAICAAAWFAWSPVSTPAGKPNPSFVVLVLEAALTGTFVIGLESLLIGLIPLRFLRGTTILKWSRTAWACLFGVAMWAFVLIFLSPGNGYNSSYEHTFSITFGVFAVISALVSALFWAFFRFRPESWEPAAFRTTLEGEFEDIERF
jgi:hypothetical protein